MACSRCAGRLTLKEAREQGSSDVEWRERWRYHQKDCPFWRGKPSGPGPKPRCASNVGEMCVRHAAGAETSRPCANVAGEIPASRKLAADARVSAAITHLNAAREQLDAACRDLCAVVGAKPAFDAIRRLSDATRAEIERIDHGYARGIEFDLDHEPREGEYTQPHRYGCGLEVSHG